MPDSNVADGSSPSNGPAPYALTPFALGGRFYLALGLYSQSGKLLEFSI